MKKIGIILIIIGLSTILYSYKPLLNTIGADSGWDSSYSEGSTYSSSSSSSDYSSSISLSRESHGAIFSTDIKTSVFVEIILSFFYAMLFSVSLPFIIKDDKTRFVTIIGLTIMRLGIVIGIRLSGFEEMTRVSLIILFVLTMITVFISFIREICSQLDFIKRGNTVRRANERELRLLDFKNNEILKSMGIDPEELKEELYQNFIDIQLAWMNFDYDKLQELCSDELYNSYKKELEVLMFKNDQNIMNSFHLKEISIENVIEQKDYLEISIYLDITFKDYVIDRSTRKVIQGNKWNKIHNEYHLEFKKNKNVLSNCPTCGSKLENYTNNCSCCGSIIPNNHRNFVLFIKEKK